VKQYLTTVLKKQPAATLQATGLDRALASPSDPAYTKPEIPPVTLPSNILPLQPYCLNPKPCVCLYYTRDPPDNPPYEYSTPKKPNA
jgi:hypothetical protein